MPGKKLRVGIAGLGRMGTHHPSSPACTKESTTLTQHKPGQRHALSCHKLTPRAQVVAASTPDARERKWAAENLEDVQVYSNYYQMLDKADLQAVVVASITSVHAEQTVAAIERGLHVLCEKPLSVDVDIVSFHARGRES